MDEQQRRQRKLLILAIALFVVAVGIAGYYIVGQRGEKVPPVRPEEAAVAKKAPPTPAEKEVAEKPAKFKPPWMEEGPPAKPAERALLPPAKAPFREPETQPYLDWRADPFGLAAVPPEGFPGERRPAAEELLLAAGWGLPQRVGVRGAPIPRGEARRVPQIPVTIPRVTRVSKAPTPPLPKVELPREPGAPYLQLPPRDLGELVGAPKPIPTIYREVEGVRLSGIVRNGKPRGIVEWTTAEGVSRQVVGPGESLKMLQDYTLESLTSEKAVLKDQAGKRWYVPFKYSYQ